MHLQLCNDASNAPCKLEPLVKCATRCACFTWLDVAYETMAAVCLVSNLRGIIGQACDTRHLTFSALVTWLFEQKRVNPSRSITASGFPDWLLWCTGVGHLKNDASASLSISRDISVRPLHPNNAKAAAITVATTAALTTVC